LPVSPYTETKDRPNRKNTGRKNFKYANSI